jgi:hypothetical protein
VKGFANTFFSFAGEGGHRIIREIDLASEVRSRLDF